MYIPVIVKPLPQPMMISHDFHPQEQTPVENDGNLSIFIGNIALAIITWFDLHCSPEKKQ